MGFQALYIHVPFCKKRCRYCDFASSTCKYGDQRAYAYIQKLESFLRACAEAELFEPILTGYIGGGTPSLLGGDSLGELLATIRACGAFRELSFEANPDSIDTKLLKSARQNGATRISIGIQSFVDNELSALGRIHSSQLAEHALKLAGKSGLDVSCDLMCGVPYQSLESWRYSLEKAIELGLTHVSVYPLMIEEGTALEALCEAGELPWPDDDVQADYMELAEQMLGQAGLERYEVASYAKSELECKHNCVYWTGREYLGLGWSAASMMSRSTYVQLSRHISTLPVLSSTTFRVRFTCTSSIDEIIGAESLDSLSFEIEELSEREAFAEDLMLQARMSAGFSCSFVDEARASIGAQLDKVLDDLVKRGLLSYNKRRYQPTHRGWLLGNELYGALWDLAKE